MTMARQAPSDLTGAVSPADLLPPGLRGALTPAPETQAPEQPEPPVAESEGEIDPQVRHRMISEAAYRLYARRGYVEGFELEDWLQAEAEVDRQLANRERELSGRPGIT
jgi:hypothetical protein